MKLNWLKNIFRTGEAKQSRTKSIKLSELESWLDQRSDQAGFEADVKEIYEKIGDVADGLGKEIRSLESAAPFEETPPKLMKAGLAARDAVKSQMESLLEKLAPPKSLDLRSVEEHHSSIVKHLATTVSKFGRSQRFVEVLFPEESKDMKSDLSSLSRLLVDLGNAIERKKKESEEVESSRALASKVLEGKSRIRDLRTRIEKDERQLADLMARDGELKLRLEKLASSDQGQMARSMKEALDAKRGEAKFIESEASDLISPLSKAISRAAKQSSSERLPLEHSEAFDLLARSPVEALSMDLSGALAELKTNLGALGLKDRKMEKVQDQIDYLLDSKSLEALGSRYSKALDEIGVLEKKLSECSSDFSRAEEELKQLSFQSAGLQSGLERSRNELELVKERFDKDYADLRSKAEKIAGNPVDLVDESQD